MVGNGWEMVGVYPTYVLQAEALMAGAFFFIKSLHLFIKNAFVLCLYDKTSFLL